MWTTAALVLTVLFIIFYKAALRPPCFPPGPFALPILGNILSILPSPKDAFKRFQEKYGPICGYKVFDSWTVIINDPALMKPLLADPVFSARKHLYLFSLRDEVISGQKMPLGILGTSGDVWKNQRRFTLRSLKDLGFGRNSIEPIMQKELEDLIKTFSQTEGQKVDVGLTFNSSIINVIWAMVIGKRFSHEDARLQELVDKVNKMVQSFNPFHPAYRYPIIKKFFPNLDVYKCQDNYMRQLLEFIEIIMLALYEMKEAETEEKDSPLNMHHLKANIFELFLAGSETTASTLWWAVYLLASNPDVQEAIQKELDQVLGPEKLPTLAHMDSLPYTTAAIYEVQRIADLVPFAVPHQTTENATVAGYHIPKNTTVMFNLSHGLKDPKFWKYPDRFYPEHFLTDEGKPFKPETFMPFGAGKRVCLGESLARLELFLFFTTLVHRFSWKITDDPVIWERSIVLSRPPKFLVEISNRNSSAVF
ncbi:cytochrome P450 2J4-like [Penaeus japonicus]|uniref:cytochrome P450 2J4-like n=1 Tax=Penaeus japonicus TaxID=27405 RepID=UPI001C70B3B2|nr:cytochrome P450 2J4-like [Penaeus japonicus]